MQKTFNAAINGKGSVGKSFFAVNFVQHLKDNGAHTAVDTDNENSTLKRFHPEAMFLDIEELTEIDSVFATLDKNGSGGHGLSRDLDRHLSGLFRGCADFRPAQIRGSIPESHHAGEP